MLKTKEEHILECVRRHNGFYDYSKADFKSMNDKILIICPRHGEFYQRIANHKRGYKCPYCSGSKKHFSDLELDDRYLFDESSYVNTQTEMRCVCPKHGAFKRKPAEMEKGYYCLWCQKGIEPPFKSLRYCNEDTKKWWKENRHEILSFLESSEHLNGSYFKMILSLKEEGYISNLGEALMILGEYDRHVSPRKFGKSFEAFVLKYGNDAEKRFKLMNSNRDTSSLESFVRRYGEEEGLRRYNKRCESIGWSNTLEGSIEKNGSDAIYRRKQKSVGRKKTEEQKKHLRYTSSKESIVSKYGEEYYYNMLQTRKYKSLQSENYIRSLIHNKKVSRGRGISHKEKEILKEFDGIAQYKIESYVFDMFLPDYNIVIEYNGSPFHANPFFYREHDCPNFYCKERSCLDIWEYDKKKCDMAVKNGIKRVFYIWDSSEEFDLNLIREYLKNHEIL